MTQWDALQIIERGIFAWEVIRNISRKEKPHEPFFFNKKHDRIIGMTLQGKAPGSSALTRGFFVCSVALTPSRKSSKVGGSRGI